MGDSSNFLRINNRGINFAEVEEFTFCNQQVYIIYRSGRECIIKDKEEVAAFGQYMSGTMPNIVEHDVRQQIIRVNNIARRKLYTEADMIERRLNEQTGVDFKPGPGFAGYGGDHPPNKTGGDPALPPGLTPRMGPGPGKKPCCGKGGDK